MDRKVEDYFAAGVREVWQIFPRRREVQVPTAGPARLLTASQAIGSPILAGLILSRQRVLREIADAFRQPNCLKWRESISPRSTTREYSDTNSNLPAVEALLAEEAVEPRNHDELP